MARQITTFQEWLNLDQVAEYLGVSKRSVINAIDLCKSSIANQELKLKKFGSKTLVSKTSIDESLEIVTNKKNAPQNMGGIV
jgi:predicted DNA-binding protein YlxM (UPF0122 family)|tara:strand:+ start:4800 stop:5045 length:246 start_codon:yes stop_codon:yes gene_type:complete